MSYLDIVAEVRRLPLHEQLKLMEELVHALQNQVLAQPSVPEHVAPMSALRGILKPENGTLPTDEEIRQIIADDLLEKHA
jgi:hypothetical protein